MKPGTDPMTTVTLTRLEALRAAIVARDWKQVEFEHDRTLRSLTKPGPRAPINAPDSTLDDLHNDLAALTMAKRLAEFGHEACEDVEARRGTAAEGLPSQQTLEGIASLYRDGAGAFEPSALVAWLSEKIAETENTIDALEGTGMPATPTARLLVEMDGGLIQNVHSDTPGVVVIVRDADVEGSDLPRIVEDADGPAFWNTWTPEGDDEERRAVDAAVPFVEEAERRHAALFEAEEGGTP